MSGVLDEIEFAKELTASRIKKDEVQQPRKWSILGKLILKIQRQILCLISILTWYLPQMLQNLYQQPKNRSEKQQMISLIIALFLMRKAFGPNYKDEAENICLSK